VVISDTKATEVLAATFTFVGRAKLDATGRARRDGAAAALVSVIGLALRENEFHFAPHARIALSHRLHMGHRFGPLYVQRLKWASAFRMAAW
jgi:hypothetical protein